MVDIRDVRMQDAPALLELYQELDRETSYMLLEPGERDARVEAQERRIRDALDEPNHKLLVADADGELVGFVVALGGPYRRNSHKAHVATGVRRAFWGRGIGTQLFENLIRWAEETGLRRLELLVMTTNEAAIALYRKMGFEVEGTKRHSLLVDGELVDEWVMARLF